MKFRSDRDLVNTKTKVKILWERQKVSSFYVIRLLQSLRSQNFMWPSVIDQNCTEDVSIFLLQNISTSELSYFEVIVSLTRMKY